MAYASQSEIELAAGGHACLVQIADWDNDGVIDAAVIARAQAVANSWIDEILRGHYALPLTSPGESLVRLASDECVYLIKTWRPSSRLALTPADFDERKMRIAELEAYRLGHRRPDSAPQSTALRSVWVENDDADEAPVSREGLKGMW